MMNPGRTPRWWARWLITAAFACGAVVLGTAGAANAHASLVSTDPAEGAVLTESPGNATFTFDESVSLPDDGVHVFDADGDEIESSAASDDKKLTVTVPTELADGTYVVTWRVVSDDGHPIAGSLSFSVGAPSLIVASPRLPATGGSEITLALSLANATTYLGLFCALGLAIFIAFLLPSHTSTQQVRERLRRWFTGAAAVGVSGALIGLPLTVIDQRGHQLDKLLTAGPWTGIDTTAFVGFAAFAAGLALCAQSLQRTRPGVLLAPGAAAVAISPALTGHTRAFQPELGLITVDLLHVLAGSIWLGGLIGLVATLPALASRPTHVAGLLSRFSTLAAAILVAVAASGTILAWRIVETWDNLFHTTYGVLLITKIGLVVVVAAIAGWNRWRLLPSATKATGFEAQRRSVTTLTRAVAAEGLTIIVVLCLTGFLINQSPRQAAYVAPELPTQVAVAALTPEVKVLATMTPGVVGPNTILIQLQDAAGDPWEPAHTPDVTLSSDGVDLGAVVLAADASGTYQVDVVLPTEGAWTLQVSLRVSTFDNPVALVRLDVDKPEG